MANTRRGFIPASGVAAALPTVVSGFQRRNGRRREILWSRATLTPDSKLAHDPRSLVIASDHHPGIRMAGIAACDGGGVSTTSTRRRSSLSHRRWREEQGVCEGMERTSPWPHWLYNPQGWSAELADSERITQKFGVRCEVSEARRLGKNVADGVGPLGSDPAYLSARG
jgi:hypothetical protein